MLVWDARFAFSRPWGSVVVGVVVRSLGYRQGPLAIGTLAVAAIFASVSLALKGIEVVDARSAAFDDWASLAACCIVILCIGVGRSRALTYAIIATIFTVFASLTAARWLQGASDCGCFGQAIVAPWRTLLLDTTIVLCAVAVAIRAKIPRLSSFVGLTILIGASVLAMEPIILSIAPRDSGATAANTAWIGSIETDDDLSRGRWELIVIRHGCDKCERYVAALPAAGSEDRRMLVEMEPYGDVSDLMAKAGAVGYGRLPMNSPLPIYAAPFQTTLTERR